LRKLNLAENELKLPVCVSCWTTHSNVAGIGIQGQSGHSLQLAAQLQAIYPVVLVEDDLEEGEDLEEDETRMMMNWMLLQPIEASHL
jgi:hypothetical protein